VVYLLFFFSVQVSDIFYFQVPVVLIFTKFDALVDKCYKSCDLKERIIKRLKMQCMNLQTKPFRMSIFLVC
jgi:hypothetical protein